MPGSNDWKFTQGIIQPTVLQISGKHLRLYARSTSKTARVTIADSYDNGLTWTAAKPLDVPNPNSGRIFGGSGNRVIQLGLKYIF